MGRKAMPKTKTYYVVVSSDFEEFSDTEEGADARMYDTKDEAVTQALEGDILLEVTVTKKFQIENENFAVESD